VKDEQTQYVPLAMDTGTAKFDVIVDDAPSAPNEKEKTWAVIEKMMPVLAQADLGMGDWADILEYSPLPSSFANKVREKAKQQEQDPSQQLAVQMGAAELQLKQAQAQKTMAEAQATGGEAQVQQAEQQFRAMEMQADAQASQQERQFKAAEGQMDLREGMMDLAAAREQREFEREKMAHERQMMAMKLRDQRNTSE